jgi:putative ABC transport system ATP-binding protein
MIEIKEMAKVYDLGTVQVKALMDVSLSIGRGEFLTIMGPSGSGKSTLLHLLGILDQPTSGHYFLEGHDITNLPDRELSRIRNEHFGFVFQSFNLFPEFSAIENVMMPLAYAKVPMRERKEKASALLDKVGLKHRMYHFPNMLSGGEQQRVAIARALANDPDLILADEPTGNLPSVMGREILKMLYALNEQGTTIVMVTHDDKLGACGKRLIRLKDGCIVHDGPVQERYNPDLNGEEQQT